MIVYICQQQAVSPCGKKREMRVYALTDVAYKINDNGEQIVDLNRSTVHDWSSTLSWYPFCYKLMDEGHTCLAA